MAYQIKNFDNLIGLKNFSDQLLKNHFALYQGYVNNFNKLNDILVAMEKDGKYGIPEYAELNRRLGWEWNGMRLHELYFGNLISATEQKLAMGTKIDQNSQLYKIILKEFGSYEFWEKDFKAMAIMRGIGWVVLYYDPAPEQIRYGTGKSAERLFNVWINEHDIGHFAGCVPLLAIDVFEHAYMLDYGIKRADYVEVFMKAIDWKAANQRINA